MNREIRNRRRYSRRLFRRFHGSSLGVTMFLMRKAARQMAFSMRQAHNAFELMGQSVRELQYIDPVREAIITVPEGTTSAFVDDKPAKIITREQILETIKKSFNIEGEKTPWGT